MSYRQMRWWRATGPMRHGCTAYSRRLRIAIWTGRNRGSKGFSGFWGACTGSICATQMRPEAAEKRRSRGHQHGPDTLKAGGGAIQRKLHQTIKRVSDDFQGRWHFNTCIAAIMELVNEIYGARGSDCCRTGPRCADR